MGAQRTGDSVQYQPGISFLLGAERVHVLILKPQDLSQRNVILDAVLNLSALRPTYQLVYLAAPRLFGASVDAEVFRSRGIGLLLYDERRIDEAVGAQTMPRASSSEASEHPNDVLVTELATLKSMYLEMERTVDQLRHDLASLHNPNRQHGQRFELPEDTTELTTPPSFPDASIRSGELPSYFINNPWLDVLSKRGNGREQIAA
jgi:hypothetical protein